MSSATSTSPVMDEQAEWVQQQPHLWVGRLNGQPAGTIERGRRYTFVSPEGVARRGFGTLADAQQAAGRPTPGDLVEVPRLGGSVVERVLLTASSAALATAVGLVTIAALAPR